MSNEHLETAVDLRVVQDLNRLFVRTLRRMADLGGSQEACEIAAEAWSLLRERIPGEAERHNGVLHYLTRTQSAGQTIGGKPADDFDLEVRHLAPAQRHELILETYNKLQPGQGFILINDHNPKPLYFQFSFEYPDAFTWEAIESGPEVWRVRIGKPSQNAEVAK